MRSSYTSSYYSVYMWPKPNLCPAPLCLRLLQHLRHRLDREHSDPKQCVVRAVSRPCSLPHQLANQCEDYKSGAMENPTLVKNWARVTEITSMWLPESSRVMGRVESHFCDDFTI